VKSFLFKKKLHIFPKYIHPFSSVKSLQNKNKIK